MMRVISSGIVYAGQKAGPFSSCAFAQICVLPSGRWLCCFRAAPRKLPTAGQQAVLCYSDDEGASWSKPCAPFSPGILEGKQGLYRSAAMSALGGKRVLAAICWVDHSDPDLDFFNEQTQGLLDTRIFLAWSQDEGQTWTQPELMDVSPFDVPVPLTGPVLCLANGDLACQFELNKHYYDLSQWHHKSVLMFSKDQGKTWRDHSIVSQDPENRVFYWDQRPSVLADGRVLDLFWTFDTKQAVYLNIHARESHDNGRSWGEIWDCGVPGQPAPAVELPDGRLAMVYVDRQKETQIKARVSSDAGRTWPEDSELLVYKAQANCQTVKKGTMQDAWAEMGAFSIGLPATARLANGDVLAVFYAGPNTDKTDIHWVRLGLPRQAATV